MPREFNEIPETPFLAETFIIFSTARLKLLLESR